jgi:hypothetical protein
MSGLRGNQVRPILPSAAIPDRLLDARCGFFQVFKVHGRNQLEIGIEGQKSRLHCQALSHFVQIRKLFRNRGTVRPPLRGELLSDQKAPDRFVGIQVLAR